MLFIYIIVSLLGLTLSSSLSRNCQNNFGLTVVRVSGDWTVDAGSALTWQANEPLGLMEFDTTLCYYIKVITGLKPNTQYAWKVTINNAWGENYGCSGKNGPNCIMKTDASGGIRFIFKPNTNPPQLSSDTSTTICANGPCGATSSSTATITTQGTGTTPSPTTTTASVASNCANVLANKIVRATGDWTIDAGSPTIWSATEPKGLMNFDTANCLYTLKVTDLKPNFQYKWKIVINNAWSENYGCTGFNAADCGVKSNSVGAFRLIVDPKTAPPKLTSDFNLGECGNQVCEPGETCKQCPGDCGACPPSVCGDNVCDDDESWTTCERDCPNELPNCERFNDEACKSGDQVNANAGVENRRWQTPKPGAKNYQSSFQDFHSLVGYADIKYTSFARIEADVCIMALHRTNAALTYLFDGVAQSTNCKRYSSSHKIKVSLKVNAADGTKLDIPAVTLAWNVKTLGSRPGDAVVYRNGQKGAVPEMFGWPHKDVAKECELLGKAGYLGVKLFPIHEQLMSHQPFENAMNPWYFMYQPVSYKLDGRSGTREELEDLITTCRGFGVRVYVDAILNHFTGAGNDMHDHRNPGAGCTKWGNKTTSAPIERQSPFYTHAYTYKYNQNTGAIPSNEFPGAAIGPEDFHCDRALGSWNDLFIMNNGWLVGLTDINTGKESVRERQAAYVVEMMSLGISGFRIDAAKHMSPEDISAIFKKVQTKMGGKLPDDFIAWLEILTGGEAGILWTGASHYGTKLEQILLKDLGSMSEVNKIKMWDGLYPKEPQNNPLISRHRVVIQNDDHDQQMPGSSSRDMGPFGCVLVKDCPENDHRNFELRLFQNPNGVSNNADDWPIRFILSSYYHTYGKLGIPDGKSSCSLCTVGCTTCKEDIPYIPAYSPNECGYKGNGYTRVHRDIKIINAMRQWMGLGAVSGGDIGLSGCS